MKPYRNVLTINYSDSDVADLAIGKQIPTEMLFVEMLQEAGHRIKKLLSVPQKDTQELEARIVQLEEELSDCHDLIEEYEEHLGIV